MSAPDPFPPKKEAAPARAASSGEEAGQASHAAQPQARADTKSAARVAAIRKCLGNRAVLIRVAPFGKNPTEKEWQRIGVERMADPAYLATLNHGCNIGVPLGAQSDGLCTLDMDDADELAKFLSCNPGLAETLRTMRLRGGNSWLQIEGGYPASGIIRNREGKAIGEWRSTGNQTVISGEAIDRRKGETEPTKYRVISKTSTPARLPFSALAWPADWRLPWNEPERPKRGPGKDNPSNADNADKAGKPGKAQVREMLAVIPRGLAYEEWLRVIAAVGDALDDGDAIEALNEWDAEDEPGLYAYKLARRLAEVHVGTLFHMAREYGWTPPLPKESIPTGADFADFAELHRRNPIKWDELSASSASSAGGYIQPLVIPANSFLRDWADFAQLHTEAADCYLGGAILPVIAGMLGRRIWIPLGGGKKYPNLFVLICGKPGDRKSTTINLAKRLAWLSLPGNVFLPKSFSPESLFDEYSEDCAGRPDKLWMVDDANPTLADWQKTVNGERVATRFLELYDCAELTESFRRNKKESAEGNARRVIAETSTSICFGATFNVCCFQGQAVRAGMARRFIYCVGERRARDLINASNPDTAVVTELQRQLQSMEELAGAMQYDSDAEACWRSYQRHNREIMDGVSLSQEDTACRLASAPAQVLAVSMCFEAAMWAKRQEPWRNRISLEALSCAIGHIDASLAAAGRLDGIANRATIEDDAEVLLARIVRDFRVARFGPTIYARRKELTRSYCHDSGRRGAMQPHDLYNRILPALERKGLAVLIPHDGRGEIYAFRADGEASTRQPVVFNPKHAQGEGFEGGASKAPEGESEEL